MKSFNNYNSGYGEQKLRPASNGTRRLFIAIPLPDDYLSALSRYGDDNDIKGNRWTATENLHITVSFLGDTDETLLPKIIERLNSLAAETKCFVLRFDKIFLAPPGRIPNMVWAIFFDSENFARLAQGVSDQLNNLLALRQEHKSIPHVTLARFRDYQAWRDIKLNQLKITDLLVDKIQLFESRLKPEGPTYNKIADFNFKQ